MAKDGNRDFVTPFGEARYATLDREENIPGKGPTGKKCISLVLTGAALEAVKAEVENFILETFPPKKAAGVNRPFKTDEKTGQIYIKANTFAFEKGTKKDKRVPLSNAKGDMVQSAVLIGDGSVIRLKTTLQATEFQGKDFIKFWLNGIQVKKLEKYVPRGAAFDAADDEGEGGWTGDEFDEEPEGPSTDKTVAPEAGADF